MSNISTDLFLSGSFDHTVKLYDARTPSGSTISVDHGAPVESVLMYPGNSVFVSVGEQASCIGCLDYLIITFSKAALSFESGICWRAGDYSLEFLSTTKQ